MAGIPPPPYPQYSQPVPPAPPYPQYMQQYPPPPPQQYNPYPPKPQRPIRTKIMYRHPPKPSNAIFIKNIPYDLSNEEFHDIYSKFGEIYSITNRINNRGMAFITYFKIQSAIDAVEQMKNFKVHDRIPTTSFSFRPPSYSKIDPKTTSTIVEVRPIQPTNQEITQDQVTQVLSKFGEIYQVHDIGHNDITVQFCDMRDAKEAADQGTNIDIGGISCKVELYVEPVEPDAIIQPVLPPQHYPPNRVPPGPPPPPSYQQMPPPSYQQPQQISQQMPIPPPPPPPQYSQQMQIPPYGAPQQIQPYQYGAIPPPPPPPPRSQQIPIPPNQQQPQNANPLYQSYSPGQINQPDITTSVLSSLLK